MNKITYSIIALAMVFGTSKLMAQADSNSANHTLKIKIPEVTLIDIEGGAEITLEATAPTEAGEPLKFDGTNSTDNSLWINYSVIVPTAASTRKKITVALSEFVPGIDVKLAVGEYTGAGLGNKGSGVSGPTTLSTTAKDAVTDIGSSHTGDGANSGHQLTYSFDVESGKYGDIFAKEFHEVTVTYTIVNP